MLARIASRGVSYVAASRIGAYPQINFCKGISTAAFSPSTSTMPLAQDSYVNIPMSTDSIGLSDSSHSSVKRTIQSLKEKGEVTMFDVQVGDIIASKPDQSIVVISPNSTVFDAVKTMSDCKVGALVVTDPITKRPLGMISERDYLNKVVLKGLSSKTTMVNDIMTKDIITTSPTVSAIKCMDIMTKGRFRHIPVVDEKGALLGLISIGDLVKHVLDQQAVTIQHLKSYIERTY